MAITKINGSLYLKLDNERNRYMGSLLGRNLFVQRDKDKHLHRNTNSYGINKEIVDSELFDILTLEEFKDNKPIGFYVVPREDIKLCPAYKASDFEIQLMMNLDWLNEYKRFFHFGHLLRQQHRQRIYAHLLVHCK